MEPDRKAFTGMDDDSVTDIPLDIPTANNNFDTVQTEQFVIGQRVYVSGQRPGKIAYIGETHFAPGEWAGIVLDEPNGKNDGCVSGKRYFQCEPKKGVFSRLSRLTLELNPSNMKPPFHKESRSSLSPRSGVVSPVPSISYIQRNDGKRPLAIDDRVIVSSSFGSRPGTLKYIGETKFAPGNWCGICLDEPTGKNDGSVDGIKYFDCLMNYGVFVPVAKVSLSPSTRKGRLSRAVSRESISSIGTTTSIATTNISQRNSSQKPVGTSKRSIPKSSFSLQDVIREKQNHIEQLLVERELDRDDSHKQSIFFQEKINELSSQVAELQKKLEKEKKKTEDLQLIVDEVTFCRDEVNAQAQVYKERLMELEADLTNQDSSFANQALEDNQTDTQPANKLHRLTKDRSNFKLAEYITKQIENLEIPIDKCQKLFEAFLSQLKNIPINEIDAYEFCLNSGANKKYKTNDIGFQTSLDNPVVDSLLKEPLVLLQQDNNNAKNLNKSEITDCIEISCNCLQIIAELGQYVSEFDNLKLINDSLQKRTDDLAIQNQSLKKKYCDLQNLCSSQKNELLHSTSSYVELDNLYKAMKESYTRNQLECGSLGEELRTLKQVYNEILLTENAKYVTDSKTKTHNQQLQNARGELSKTVGKAQISRKEYITSINLLFRGLKRIDNGIENILRCDSNNKEIDNLTNYAQMYSKLLERNNFMNKNLRLSENRKNQTNISCHSKMNPDEKQERKEKSPEENSKNNNIKIYVDKTLELESNKKAKTNIERLNKENCELQGKLRKLEDQFETFKSKFSNLNSSQSFQNETASQISFLNSIIVDMQRKNENLKGKLEILENFSNDVSAKVFDSFNKRKPAPRTFCDMCEVFDSHETEDCPIQSSDSGTVRNESARKIQEPRKYCQNCEVFGHDTKECTEIEIF